MEAQDGDVAGGIYNRNGDQDDVSDTRTQLPMPVGEAQKTLSLSIPNMAQGDDRGLPSGV